MKKKLALFVVLALVVSMLSACGKTEPATPGGDAGSEKASKYVKASAEMVKTQGELRKVNGGYCMVGQNGNR